MDNGAHPKSKKSLKNEAKDTVKYDKLPLLHSMISKGTSEGQSSSVLPISCSRCQSLKRGSSLHLTLAYRKCRCHRQFEHKISESKVTTVCNLTSSSTVSRIAEVPVDSTPVLQLPPLEPLPLANVHPPVLQIADSARKKLIEQNSSSSEKLPCIVR